MPGHKTVKHARSSRRIVFLAVPPISALDLIGPAEVFSLANALLAPKAPAYEIQVLNSENRHTIASESGIALQAHMTLAEERRNAQPIDTLIVTVGYSNIGQYPQATLDWLIEKAKRVRRLCSICVGAFVLAQAGLLEGRRATTHWLFAPRLAERFPNVEVDPAPIWVKSANIYTSAGITAGIDLALELVAQDLGDEHALKIARAMVLFLRRPGGQAQFSAVLAGQATNHRGLQKLQRWIGEHLDADLGVAALAEHAAMSTRSLIRLFRKELDITPATYVEDLRVEAARRELEMNGAKLEVIAARCGFRSADVMRRVFLRRLGVTPRQYMDRFAMRAPG